MSALLLTSALLALIGVKPSTLLTVFCRYPELTIGPLVTVLRKLCHLYLFVHFRMSKFSFIFDNKPCKGLVENKVIIYRLV